jgi:hypothetical protein
MKAKKIVKATKASMYPYAKTTVHPRQRSRVGVCGCGWVTGFGDSELGI